MQRLPIPSARIVQKYFTMMYETTDMTALDLIAKIKEFQSEKEIRAKEITYYLLKPFIKSELKEILDHFKKNGKEFKREWQY